MMKFDIKDKILIVTVIVSIACLVVAVNSARMVKQNQKTLDEERFKRFAAEEDQQKFLNRYKSIENDLINARNQVQGVQAILEKEKLASENLKNELDKVVKINEMLGHQLNSAVPNVPAQQPQAQP